MLLSLIRYTCTVIFVLKFIISIIFFDCMFLYYFPDESKEVACQFLINALSLDKFMPLVFQYIQKDEL